MPMRFSKPESRELATRADPFRVHDRILATATDADAHASEFSARVEGEFLARVFRDGFEHANVQGPEPARATDKQGRFSPVES